MNIGNRYHVPFTSHLNVEGVDEVVQRRYERFIEKGIVVSDEESAQPGPISVPEIELPENLFNLYLPEPDHGKSIEGNQYRDLELPLKELGFVVLTLDNRKQT
jgi:hypothetical protein